MQFLQGSFSGTRRNLNMFPTVSKLLTILATLPLTTCPCERSFSSLNYLKIYLCATTEVRLNGIAFAFIREDMEISSELV